MNGRKFMINIRLICKYLKISLFILCLNFNKNSFANSCPSQVIENKKPPIAFKPFPMENPNTGDKIPPNEIVEVSDRNGNVHKLKAIDFFNQINSIEKTLNAWGYSLREADGSYELSKVFICIKLLESQKAALQKTLKEFSINKMLSYEEWKKNIKDTWNAYKEFMPSLKDISKYIDSGKVDEFLTTVPTFNFSTPTLKQVELKSFHKEKKWNFNKGDRGSFYIEGYASYFLKGSKIEVDADARAGLAGALYNNNVNIIHAEANARAPGTQAGRLNASIVFLGQTVYSLDDPFQSEKLKPYSYNKELYKNEVNYEYPVRIPIGPINIRLAVGIRGQTKVHWGLDILPLQINAYVQHYAGLDAYANAAIDVWVAGVFVEGRLLLIAKDTRIQGNVLAEYDEYLSLNLSLVGKTTLKTLDGDLSVGWYVYLPSWEFWNYFVKKHTYRHKLWGYEGFKHEGTIFDYSAKLTPFGYSAKGDLSVDDVLEQKDINTRLVRAEKIAKVEQEAQIKLQKTALYIINDLKSEKNIRLISSTSIVSNTAKAIDDTYDIYLRELLKWVSADEEI